MTPYDKERQIIDRLLNSGVISHMTYLEHLAAIDAEEMADEADAQMRQLDIEREEAEVLWREEDDES